MPNYNWIDIGSSNKGGSIRYCQKHFGSRGYGIDIDERKVTSAQQKGYDVRLKDIKDVTDTAQWCTAIHVIEHLSGREEATEMIARMLDIGERVLLIWPYFDADAYLMRKDYKLFWSHWSGHPYHCTSLEMHNILLDLGVDYEIEYNVRIGNSDDPAIIPLNAPKDSLGYRPEMGEKPFAIFDHVYRETIVKI